MSVTGDDATSNMKKTHHHRVPLPSDFLVLNSMKVFCFHQSFPSACEPAQPPFQPVKQQSALFPVPCAVVYTQLLLAVGPLLSLGTGREFLSERCVMKFMEKYWNKESLAISLQIRQIMLV